MSWPIRRGGGSSWPSTTSGTWIEDYSIQREVAFVSPRGGTDIWDYGREFLLRGDESDFKVLRTPM